MSEASAVAVEMLWEQGAPEEILASRFGFEGTDAASRWVLEMLERHWGIHAEVCERIVMSDHNALAWVRAADEILLLKWSIAPQHFPRLAAVAELTNWLASRGIPVSALVPALDGSVQVESGSVSMGLQHKIEGTMLDAADDAQVYAAGVALARLQEALREYPDAERIPGIESSGKPLADRVTGWLSSCPDHVPEAARAALRRRVDAAPADELPVQLVHFDYRAANILWTSGEVAAILDFEEAWLDHRVVELARSAVLLGTVFHDWSPVSTEVRNRFRAGYESESPLTVVEAAWWDALVLWFSLAMIPAGDDPQGWGAAALSQLS
ncbi:phosphotransferase [Gryllotalpicola koreensis]|uniref:Aminoglycoside phosphotransferase domain-containing protein n=1 Tax=Gryllotalpicola koreensis TaxID=993086 RepID=A0ABP8A606_9MICO